MSELNTEYQMCENERWRGRCHVLMLPKNDTLPHYLISIKQGDKPREVQAFRQEISDSAAS
jgi:hypothetical protein